MSNTIDANLTNQIIGASGIGAGASTGYVAPLLAYATRIRPLGEARTGIVEVPLLSGFTSAATSGAFNSGNCTAAAIAVDVAHYRKAIHFSSPHRNQGMAPGQHLVDAAIANLELELQAVALAKITNATHGAADIESTAANFDTTDLEALAAASTSSPRAALISTAALAGVAQDLKREGGRWIYPGLDNGVFEATLNAGEADVAVVAGSQAFAFIVEKPLGLENLPAPSGLKVSEIVLPRLGIPCWRSEWFDLATREQWISLHLLFGASAADATALSYAAAPA